MCKKIYAKNYNYFDIIEIKYPKGDIALCTTPHDKK